MLLQVVEKSPTEAYPFGEVIRLVILSIVVLYLVQLSGKINLGLYLPWIMPPMRKTHRQWLKKHNTFYSHLSRKEQRDFEKRVQYFIRSKKFIPRQMKRVTSEMKVLLAATAVQLTYGLPQIRLAHFSYILVYPDDYYSLVNKTYHKGEVNPSARAIVVSWKSFLEGYQNPTNGRNLGLHEMAHALFLENDIKNREYNFFEKHLWQQWQAAANQIMDEINSGKHTFLRSYAATNTHEFFAVSIEYFFEKPIEFQDKLPAMYNMLTQLLKQDTAKRYQARPQTEM